MQVQGKMMLFVEEVDFEGGKFNTYSTSISHKNEDGTYLNTSLEVQFTNSFLTEDKKKRLVKGKYYQLDVKDGWLDTRAFKTKEGKVAKVLVLKINDAELLKAEKIKQDNQNGW